MLLVETMLGKSPIHGWGVFARQRIPAGTRTWEFTPGVDLLIDPEAVDGAREDLRHLLVHYTYLHPVLRKRVLLGDITRFMNHSETPNVRGVNDGSGGHDVAVRDIEAGEELTVDYREFDDADLLALVGSGAPPPTTA